MRTKKLGIEQSALTLLQWVLVNGAFLAVLVAAVLTEWRWLTNIGVFLVWLTLGATLCTTGLFVVTSVILKLDPTKNVAPEALASYEVQEKLAKLQASQEHLLDVVCQHIAKWPIPRWVDVTYDLLVLGLLVGAGWWVSGVAYLLAILLQQYHWAFKRQREAERWAKVEAALKGEVAK